jgi:hypothetical protein
MCSNNAANIEPSKNAAYSALFIHATLDQESPTGGAAKERKQIHSINHLSAYDSIPTSNEDTCVAFYIPGQETVEWLRGDKIPSRLAVPAKSSNLIRRIEFANRLQYSPLSLILFFTSLCDSMTPLYAFSSFNSILLKKSRPPILFSTSFYHSR